MLKYICGRSRVRSISNSTKILKISEVGDMNLRELPDDNDILSGLVLPSLHSSVRGRVIAKGVLASETL